jgi:BirA family biotin operon repressor/biotin-[acetyl-CoA-carboxylase] ligase
VPGGRARSVLASGPGRRFADVRWVAETGSTNTDAMELARQGEPEGIVLVADHQTAGRGRAGRTWTAPPGAGLLLSILLRPPTAVMDLTTMAVAVSAAAAVGAVAGFSPRVKWPNDLVWPGDGSTPDRKLAGVLAEADWPASASISAGWKPPAAGERAVVVVGIGLNVSWPSDLPADLAEIAVAMNHVVDAPVDREDLLIALLSQLGPRYLALCAGDRAPLLDEWRARSATLGRRVRVELGADDVVGTPVDVTDDGHHVVETLEGLRRTFAVGDVVHLCPA